MNKFSEKCSQAVQLALSPLLDELVEINQAYLIDVNKNINREKLVLTSLDPISKFTSPFRIGLRVNINRDNVGYMLGMNGKFLNEEKFLVNLDNELIAIMSNVNNMTISLELIFCISERFNCQN